MKQNITDKYVETQARKMPIYKCFINGDWQEQHLSNIMIIRKQTNGKYTFGCYLVDRLYFGLKQSFYGFNMTLEHLESMKKELPDITEIDYPTVHHIIYGGIEYANKLGYKPHDKWKTAQYVLDKKEDVDDVKIEFGHKSKPSHIPSILDSAHERAYIASVLNRKAGPDNIKNIRPSNDKHLEDWHKDEEQVKAFILGKTAPTLQQAYLLYSRIYLNNYKGMQMETCLIDQDKILNLEKNTTLLHSNFEQKLQLTEETKSLFEQIARFNFNLKDLIAHLETLYEQNNNKSSVCCLLYAIYSLSQERVKADKLQKEGLKKFPDFILFKLLIAFYYMESGCTKKGLAELNYSFYLDEAFPDIRSFSKDDFILFNSTICLYWIAKKDLISAFNYANVLLKYSVTNAFATKTISKLVLALDEILMSQSDLDRDSSKTSFN